MLQEILLEFFPGLLETFDESVLTSVPSGNNILRGVYDPLASPTRTTTSSTSTSTSSGTNAPVITSTPPPPKTAPTLSSEAIIKNFKLRYYKKPDNLVPLLDSNNDPISFSYNDRLSGNQPIELQNALNSCTRYSDCWGITIQNIYHGLNIRPKGTNYIFKLMKQPTTGDVLNEYLTCDPSYYTYIKEDFIQSPAPADCIFTQTTTPPPTVNTITPSSKSSWINRPKTIPPPEPSIWSNSLVWVGIISVLFIIGIGIYYVLTKKPIDYTDAIKQIKKIKISKKLT
jgi:hypothetical protein